MVQIELNLNRKNTPIMLSLQQLSQPITIQQTPAIELIVDGQSIPFLPGQVTLIGSRPGMGRTLLMLYIYHQLYQKYELPQLFISNEEEENLLYNKLIATVTQVNIDLVQDRKEESILRSQTLTSDKCFMGSFYGSWEELKEQLVAAIAEKGVQLLFIDKIQGVYCEQNCRNRDQEVGNIIKELKILAVEKQVSIVVSSSLNRSVESREGKKPRLSDLRDSGSLEDIADTVLFLHRPEYYGFTEDDEGNSLKGVAELLFAKNRKGNTENMQLLFDKDIPCFKPWSPSDRFSFNNSFNKMVEQFGLTENPGGLNDPPF